MFRLLLLTAPLAADEEVRKASEAIGHILGKNLEEYGLDFDLDAVVQGLKEETGGKAKPLDECVQTVEKAQDKKISLTVQKILQDNDYEDHPISAPNSSKYR